MIGHFLLIYRILETCMCLHISVSVFMFGVVSRRQHLCQQLLCFLFLDLQLLRSLPDQLLQVRRVLLQHPQHGVNDVRLLPLVDVLKLSRHSRIKNIKYTERRNCSVCTTSRTSLFGAHWPNSAIFGSVQAVKLTSQSAYQVKDLIKGGSLVRLFIPALFHQLDAF